MVGVKLILMLNARSNPYMLASKLIVLSQMNLSYTDVCSCYLLTHTLPFMCDIISPFYYSVRHNFVGAAQIKEVENSAFVFTVCNKLRLVGSSQTWP